MGISSTDIEKLNRYQDIPYLYRSSWFQLMRPLTFSGTISPIMAGTALASLYAPVRWDVFFVMIIAALIVQATANMFNDYFDFKNGQDAEKWKDSGERIDKEPAHHHIPYAALGMLSVAVILGAWLSMQSSWWVALIGSVSIVFGYLYSAGKHSLSALGLGELTAAVFLGFVTTILSFVVQGHAVDGYILAIALTFAMLISTMILSNNIRDLQKDQGFRNTLPMKLGRKNAFRFLSILLISIYVWAIFLVIIQIVPWTAILSLLAVPVAIRLRWSYRLKAAREEEIKGMKWAARHHWTFGMLFAIGIWTGGFFL
ncbi:1,4-dihydroxy-2-naphthoate octaprenyltransferase [Virgibacillus kimchii]